MRRAAVLVLAALLVALTALAPSTSGATRERFDTQVLALIPSPGFPARAYVAPNHRVYEGTYTNPNGDSVPSTREPGGDRAFVPLDHPEIWLKQGDPTIYFTQPPP